MATKNTQKNKEIKEKVFEEWKLINIDSEIDTINNKTVIGVDESGVGDYLSPLVAAAALVTPSEVNELIKLGVTDSKKLSDKKILEIAPKIRELLKYYNVNFLTQKGYNSLNGYFNAHELKMLVHLKAINFVENRKELPKIDFVLIDKYSSEKSINEYYKTFMKNTRIQTYSIKNNVALLEKAEMHSIAVASASILAREKLLMLMKDQVEGLGMDMPLGTNEEVEKVAIKFIKEYGRKNLYQVAKIKFKTTEKIDQILKEKND